MASLAINKRTIQTVLQKLKHCETETVIEMDKREKHKNHKRNTKKSKIESQNILILHLGYIAITAANRFQGNLNLTDLHREYVKLCKEENHEYGNYQL